MRSSPPREAPRSQKEAALRSQEEELRTERQEEDRGKPEEAGNLESQEQGSRQVVRTQKELWELRTQKEVVVLRTRRAAGQFGRGTHSLEEERKKEDTHRAQKGSRKELRRRKEGSGLFLGEGEPRSRSQQRGGLRKAEDTQPRWVAEASTLWRREDGCSSREERWWEGISERLPTEAGNPLEQAWGARE